MYQKADLWTALCCILVNIVKGIFCSISGFQLNVYRGGYCNVLGEAFETLQCDNPFNFYNHQQSITFDINKQNISRLVRLHTFVSNTQLIWGFGMAYVLACEARQSSLFTFSFIARLQYIDR